MNPGKATKGKTVVWENNLLGLISLVLLLLPSTLDWRVVSNILKAGCEI